MSRPAPPSKMHPLNVFRDLTAARSRLGFFTRQTCDEIPPDPGCYGWFLPLWLLRDTLPGFLNTFGGVLTHEPRPPQEVDAGFIWDRVKVKTRRTFDSAIPPIPAFAIPLWDHLYSDQQARDALQHILLQASILTPPLYVGKTDNLRRRYNNHVTPPKGDTNNFHNRFTACATELGISLSVADLIFVCIRTGRDAEEMLSVKGDAAETEKLLEEILKRLCRPPFSER